MDLLAILGPIADFVAFLTASNRGFPANQAQMLGFASAAALCLGSVMLARFRRSIDWTAGRYGAVIAAISLAYFLRNGLFALLIDMYGVPSEAAAGIAVLVTAVMTRTGLAYCAEGSSLRLGEGKNWRIGALGLMLFAYLLRLIYCAQIELLPTEAYYWNYSRHLDFGYLDHPPMVALIIRAGTALFGSTEFGVRIGALACNLISAYFIYRLTRNLFDEASAWVAVVLMLTLPFFFSSGIVMNPDAPLVAAWTASLYYFERALIAQHRAAWLSAGLCIGLGLLSKYTIVLLGASALIFMTIDKRSRIWWRLPEPYRASLLAALIFLPVIAWNAQHDWASFAFQSTRRLTEPSSFGLPAVLGSPFLLLSPTGAIAALILLRTQAPFESVPEPTERHRGWQFLRVSIAVPLAVFTLFSLFHETLVDWLGPLWIAAFPAIAYGIAHAISAQPTRLWAKVRSAWVPTVVVLLLFDSLRFQYFTQGLPGLGYGDHPENVPVGWRELARQLYPIAVQPGRHPLIVGMDHYFLASELTFYWPDPVSATGDVTAADLFGNVGLMYERWMPPATARGRDLLLVSWNTQDLNTPQVQSSVDKLGPIQEGDLRRNGSFVRHYYYRFAQGYVGPPSKQSELNQRQ